MLVVTRMTPTNTVATIINVILTLVVTQGLIEPLIGIAWGLVMTGLMVLAMHSWLTIRSKPSLPDRAPARVEKRAIIHAALLALGWGLPPLMLFNAGNPEQQLFLSTITAGLICAGGFTLYTVPRAALTFVSILGLISALILATSSLQSAIWLLILLTVYLTIVVFAVLHAAGSFRAHVISEFQSERQKEVIQLLLNDFEQSTADVLWETNHLRQLVRTSTRLSERFGEPKRHLEGHDLLQLLREQQQALPYELRKAAEEALAVLQQQFNARQPFRDLELPVWINRQQLWWSVTAKPIDAGWRGVISDVTQTQQARQQVWELAHRDPVTGLANRRYFNQRVSELIAAPGDSLSALVSIDLDRFKAVNDTYGHDAGDKLLSIIASRLSSSLRSNDLAARMGGDEFALLLRDIDDQQQVLHICQRLLDSLQQPCRLDAVAAAVGASIGIAFLPKDGKDIDTLMKNADLAMYRAKHSGRGRVESFSPYMAASAEQYERLGFALKQSVEQVGMRLNYQVQKQLSTGQIIGLEALPVWPNPLLARTDRTELIKVAEDSGLIHQIGRQILQQSCLHARLWPTDLTIAISLSPIQLADDAIVDDIAAIIRDYRIEPSRLELQLSTAALMDLGFSLQDKLAQLQELGVKLALSDFGNGYSSISQLRRLHFDKIKLDHTFVHEACRDQRSHTLLQGVINTSHSIGITVVAEGIDNNDIQQTMIDMGVDLGQGKHIFRPVEPEVLAAQMMVHSSKH